MAARKKRKLTRRAPNQSTLDINLNAVKGCFPLIKAYIDEINPSYFDIISNPKK